MNSQVKNYLKAAGCYFLCVGLGTVASILIFHDPNMKYAPALSALLGGLIFIPHVKQTQKFGAISFMGLIMSLFFLLSGHYRLIFWSNILFALLADGLAQLGRYRTTWLNLLAYILFSFGNLGPIFLMWLSPEGYVQRLLDKGKDMAYVDAVFIPFTLANVSYLLMTVTLGALAGFALGHYVQKTEPFKHKQSQA